MSRDPKEIVEHLVPKVSKAPPVSLELQVPWIPVVPLTPLARMAKLKSFVALVKRKLLVRGVPMVREVTLDPLALLVLVEMVMLLVLLHPLVPRALVVLLASLVLLVPKVRLLPEEPL